MHSRKTWCWLSLLCFAAASTLFLNAQGTGGRILGNVSDPTGAVLGGVSVKLTNEQTGVVQTTQTDKAGHYEFPAVTVGNYRLEYEQAGFKKAIKKGLTLLVNQVITMNMTMQVGGAQEVVEVTSEAPLVETTSTQMGAVVNDRSVVQLPLNQRDTYQFLQLQPGVQSVIGSSATLYYGSDRAGAVSVNGGRGRSNNFSVNGGDANDQFVNLPTVQPSPDSIQEFRVLTNTFDAEYGRNSGAVVNVVTKSGTNRLHGDVYEFFRNKVLNSRGYFDSETPDFKQNQFGGTLGGPIIKDRTFFFGSYEGRRVRQGIPSPVVTVPTAAERAGDFSGDLSSGAFGGTLNDPFALTQRPGCAAAIPGGIPSGPTPYATLFPNNIIPIPCMDPTARDLLAYVPLPNRGSNQFQSVPVSPTRGDQFTVRIDHRINDKQNFTGYYYFNDDRTLQPFANFQLAGANVPGFGSLVGERNQQWNLTHTWTLNNTSVNEFRFTYMREGQGTFQHPQRTSLVQNSCPTLPASQCFSDPASPRLGITPGLGANREGLPFIQIAGGFNIGNNAEGELPQVGNTFQWSDSFTKVVGTHTFKFGADLRRDRFDQTLYFDVSGEYFYFGSSNNAVGDPTGNLYPDYLLGFPDQYGQGSAQVENVRSTLFSTFAQDSWKIRSNLTLNYGLRWELDTPIADVSHHVQTFRPGEATSIYPCQLSPTSVSAFQKAGVANPNCNNTGTFPLGLVVPGDKGVPNGLTQTYYKAFAPRIGLAWSPGTSGKTSIRTGWGLFYNPIEQLVLEQFSAEPPFGGSTFISNPMFNTPFLNQDGSTVTPNPFNGVLNPPRGQPVDWSSFRPILLFGQFQPKMRTQYSAQYNLNIQHQLRPDLVLQVGYVGSQGHRLLATHDINYGNPQTCLDLANLSTLNPNAVLDFAGGSPTTCGQFLEDSPFFIPAGAIPAGMTFHLPNGQTVQGGPNSPALTMVGTRPYSSPLCNYFTGAGCPQDGVPVFSSIFAQDTVANSNYNSLQASLEKRFAHGLQFQMAYTYSKSIDEASSFEGILNPIDPRRSRALSLFDARHRFVLSYYWELPVPKYSGAVGKILDGWALSGITTFQSGFPIRITSSADNELMNSFDFELPGQPDQIAPFKRLNPKNNGGYWFDPASFTENTAVDPSLFGRIGTAPRTICCGPGINNFDIAIHKNISVTESTHMEFRAEFFNAFNHTQFLNPDGNSSDGSQFGQITQARDPRLLQFALKYIF
ncbi:MAG TPA: carboxypeptidase regulatory-like domain-containing protein [Terriglobales bacterium]|nr:carboxypeptidase regulatory-like domain-containing protein [Terriglobales bacterium]